MLEGWCHVLIMLAFSGYTSAPHLQIFGIYCALSLTLRGFFKTTEVGRTYSKQIFFRYSQNDLRKQGFKWTLVLAIFPSLLLAKSLESQGTDDSKLLSRVWSYTIKSYTVIVFCQSWGCSTHKKLEDWKLKLFLVPDWLWLCRTIWRLNNVAHTDL